MDNVVINITELTNNVSFQITEDTDNVTININEGYFTCSSLDDCQVIIDIKADIVDLQEQIDNLPTATPNIQQVLDENNQSTTGIWFENLTDSSEVFSVDTFLKKVKYLGKEVLTSAREFKQGSFTAEDGKIYFVRSNITITDPTGSLGVGYIVYIVGAGNVNIGGTIYSNIGDVIRRNWNGSWTSRVTRGNNTGDETFASIISKLGFTPENIANKVTNFNSPNNTDYPTTQAVNSLVDNRVQSNIKIIGDWDATSGSMPLDDESNTTPFITQWGSTIKAGWAFRVGYGQAGTVGGFDYEEGDVVYALIDNAGTTPADWGDLDHNLQQANESLRGTSKVVTAAILADETSTDDERFITTKKIWLNFWTRVLAMAHTFAAKITFTSAPRFDSASASQYLKTDASKDLTSVSNIPATDIQETVDKRFQTDNQKYFNDATSSIQTQLNDKLNTPIGIDISSLVTIVGWASFTTKYVNITDMGTHYVLSFYIAGTSNSTTTSIDIGATYSHTVASQIAGRWTNNGGGLYGVAFLNNGTTLIQFFSNTALGTWTSSGVKRVDGIIILKK